MTDAGGRGSGIANGPRRPVWILLTIALAQLMVVLDSTIMNIALPAAQADLGFADNQRQWVVGAYAFAFGSMLLVGGRLGDRVGRRNAFIAGALGFAIASALGGLASSFVMLVVCRALQGVFAAVLAPAALAALSTTFREPKLRGRAFSAYSGVAGFGGATGLVLGGALAAYASWRWCMLINVPFAALAIAGATVFLPAQVRQDPRPRADGTGSVLVVTGIFGVVFGLDRVAIHGLADPWTFATLVTAVALLAAFVAVERRVVQPVLPLRLLADRTRAGLYLGINLTTMAMFGVQLFLTYYMQEIAGFSPMACGLAFLPQIIVFPTATIANTRLLPRLGPRTLIPCGMALISVGALALTRLDAESGYVTGLLPSIVLTGVGFGLVNSPSVNTVTRTVANADSGAAAALVTTSQQIGGAIGGALVTVVAVVAIGDGAGSGSAYSLGSVTAAFAACSVIAACAAICARVILPSGPAAERLSDATADRDLGGPAQDEEVAATRAS